MQPKCNCLQVPTTAGPPEQVDVVLLNIPAATGRTRKGAGWKAEERLRPAVWTNRLGGPRANAQERAEWRRRLYR